MDYTVLFKLNVDTLVEGDPLFRDFFANMLTEYNALLQKYENIHEKRQKKVSMEEELTKVAEEAKMKKKRRSISLDLKAELFTPKKALMTPVKRTKKKIEIRVLKQEENKFIKSSNLKKMEHFRKTSSNLCLLQTLEKWKWTNKDKSKRFDSGTMIIPLFGNINSTSNDHF